MLCPTPTFAAIVVSRRWAEARASVPVWSRTPTRAQAEPTITLLTSRRELAWIALTILFERHVARRLKTLGPVFLQTTTHQPVQRG